MPIETCGVVGRRMRGVGPSRPHSNMKDAGMPQGLVGVPIRVPPYSPLFPLSTRTSDPPDSRASRQPGWIRGRISNGGGASFSPGRSQCREACSGVATNDYLESILIPCFHAGKWCESSGRPDSGGQRCTIETMDRCWRALLLDGRRPCAAIAPGLSSAPAAMKPRAARTRTAAAEPGVAAFVRRTRVGGDPRPGLGTGSWARRGRTSFRTLCFACGTDAIRGRAPRSERRRRYPVVNRLIVTSGVSRLDWAERIR
jgi:hypothetical protein